MKKKLICSIIFASTCIAQTAMAQPEAGDREFSLAGSGGSDNSFRTNVLGVSGTYGWFQTKEFEWGIRQAIGIADVDGGSLGLSGSTALFADYHFDFAEWQPFVGASLGAAYGTSSTIEENFVIGPEIGVKYYIQPKTFIQTQATYLFRVGEDIDEGALRYTIGLGINF